MFPSAMQDEAARLLDAFRARGLRLAAAESCTGGLITALLTEIPGASDVVERGFVTYSNEAKHESLGVPNAVIAEHGAVSQPVARAMAEGALRHSHADIAVSVTGFAGPGGVQRCQAGRPRAPGCRPCGRPDAAPGVPLRRHRPRPGPRQVRRGGPVSSPPRPRGMIQARQRITRLLSSTGYALGTGPVAGGPYTTWARSSKACV